MSKVYNNLQELKTLFDETFMNFVKVVDHNNETIVPRNQTVTKKTETWNRIFKVFASKNTPDGIYLFNFQSAPRNAAKQFQFVKGSINAAPIQEQQFIQHRIDVRSYEQALADRTEIERLKYEVQNLTNERDEWKRKFEELEKEIEEIEETADTPTNPIPLSEPANPWTKIIESVVPGIIAAWGEHNEIKKKQIELEFIRAKQPSPNFQQQQQPQQPEPADIPEDLATAIDEYLLNLEPTDPEFVNALRGLLPGCQTKLQWLQKFSSMFPEQYGKMIAAIQK
jgi:hypothetical protein